MNTELITVPENFSPCRYIWFKGRVMISAHKSDQSPVRQTLPASAVLPQQVKQGETAQHQIQNIKQGWAFQLRLLSESSQYHYRKHKLKKIQGVQHKWHTWAKHRAHVPLQHSPWCPKMKTKQPTQISIRDSFVSPNLNANDFSKHKLIFHL